MLHYVSVGDMQQVLSADRLSDLIFDEYTYETDYSEVPDDPAAERGWDILYAKLQVAESKVDDALSEQMDVPLGSPPASVANAVLTIAKHLLYARKGSAAPDDVQEQYEDAMAFLDEVREGERSIETGGGRSGRRTLKYGSVDRGRFTDLPA